MVVRGPWSLLAILFVAVNDSSGTLTLTSVPRERHRNLAKRHRALRPSQIKTSSSRPREDSNPLKYNFLSTHLLSHIKERRTYQSLEKMISVEPKSNALTIRPLGQSRICVLSDSYLIEGYKDVTDSKYQ